MRDLSANCLRAESIGPLEHREYSEQRKRKGQGGYVLCRQFPGLHPFQSSHHTSLTPDLSTNSHPGIYPLD